MGMMYELNYLTFTDLTNCFFFVLQGIAHYTLLHKVFALRGLTDTSDGESWRVFGNTHPKPC